MTTPLVKIGQTYHARIRTAAGKTKTITTRTTDKAEARRIVKAAGLDELQSAAKAGRLTREAIGHITTGRKLTLTQAVAQFAQAQERRRSPKTVANTLNVLNVWLREQKLANLPPSAVTEKQVDDWINDPHSTLKAQTRNLNLSAIRSFFDFCCDHGWTSGNPAGRQRVGVKMHLIPHELKESRQLEPFTKPELTRLIGYFASQIKDLDRQSERLKLRAKRGEYHHQSARLAEQSLAFIFWQFATLLSWETGLRLGDICQLEWTCFNQPGRIRVWMDKTDQPIEHPISDKVASLLTEIPVTDARYLFPEQRAMNLDPKRRSILSVYFKRLCERNGITNKSFHCLRHTTATEAAKASGKEALAAKLADALSTEEIRKLLGHASAKTTKGYVH